MSKIVAIHGIGQQYSGEAGLLSDWLPALKDGLSRFGKTLDSDNDVRCVFYGDLFRPAGKGAILPPLNVSDITEEWEAQMLEAWWGEATRTDPAVPDPTAQTKLRTPRIVQQALWALSKSRFFAGVAERALIFDLKQVYRYLHDPLIRGAAQARLIDAVSEDTRVVVGHSLGSVVAYEALYANPKWSVETFVTLGSPLGIRHLVFDKLQPSLEGCLGAWPGSTKRWYNIADGGDVVALEKTLAAVFGANVEDRLIHNGAEAHSIIRYLNVRETGEAIASGLW